MNYGKATSNIREQLAIYIVKNKLKSLIVGISGGMDSCLCAALAKPVCDELKIPLIGRSLPMSTNAPDEIERATLTGKAFCTDFEEVNLSRYFNIISEDINSDIDPDNTKPWKIRNGNIKARLRMIYLYNLASENNGMVLSTDNYTEYLLGFWTLHGDVGDYGMIQNLWKTEVYDMAEWLSDNEYDGNKDAFYALRNTIKALATDGLGVSSLGDLGQLMPEWKGNSRDGYREVDSKLRNFIHLKENAAMTPAVIYAIGRLIDTDPVIRRHFNTMFKRINPVNIPRKIIEL